jgi:hypothetical protein
VTIEAARSVQRAFFKRFLLVDFFSNVFAPAQQFRPPVQNADDRFEWADIVIWMKSRFAVRL